MKTSSGIARMAPIKTPATPPAAVRPEMVRNTDSGSIGCVSLWRVSNTAKSTTIETAPT